MKKRHIIFKSVLLTLLLSFCAPHILQAAESEAQLNYVTDDALLLTQEEWSELEEQAQEASREYGCGIYTVTMEDYQQYNAEGAFDTAADVFHDYTLGEGEEKNGILLLLSMQNRDYGLYVYGAKAQEAFGTYAQTALEDEFLDDFASDDWYLGISDYIITCEEYLMLADAGTPVTEPELGIGGALIAAFVISSVISLIICLLLLLRMRSVKKQTRADGYAAGGLRLTSQRDCYTHTTHMRRKIEKTSSESGKSHTSSSGGTGRSGKF